MFLCVCVCKSVRELVLESVAVCLRTLLDRAFEDIRFLGLQLGQL